MIRAIKEAPEVHARRFGAEAIAAVRSGQHIRARDMALTAVHFARLSLANCPNGCGPLDAWAPVGADPTPRRFCGACGYTEARS